MFCENGLWGKRGEAGKEKQRKLWRSCQCGRKKQGEVSMEAWRRQPLRMGRGEMRVGRSCYARQLTAEKRPVDLASRSGKMELTGDLTGSQFGGVVGGEYGGWVHRDGSKRTRWEMCHWEGRQRSGKKARGDSRSREDDIKVCVYAHWSDSTGKEDLIMQESGSLQNCVPDVRRGAGPWGSSGRLALSRNKITSPLAAEYVDWLRQNGNITFMFTVLAFHLIFVVYYGPLVLFVLLCWFICAISFFCLSRPCISHTDLFTCLSLPLHWHLFNESGYLCISRHSSVFGKNWVEGMTATSVQRTCVTATQTCGRKESNLRAWIKLDVCIT